MNASIPLVLAAALLAAAGIAGAEQKASAAQPATAPATQSAQATMPSWEQLTPAQRETLVAPLRERWNASAGERARMFRHAERWRAMTPEQRNRAHN